MPVSNHLLSLLWLSSLTVLVTPTQAWTAPWAAAVATTTPTIAETTAPVEETPQQLPTKVAVIGATGRTGRYVVRELASRYGSSSDATQIVAVVRSPEKAQTVLGDLTTNDENDNKNIELCTCPDLTNRAAVAQALQGVDVAIWCATGFSSEQSNTNLVDRAKTLLGIATKRTIDSLALPLIAQALMENNNNKNNNNYNNPPGPQIIMCSSAGVTRPTWDDAKKARFPGAADIPIVRLNPFGILDVKRESEEGLRKICNDAAVPYCIVRPCGLNDNWPAGSRPIVSQGDVAVGRMNRRDVAALLVDLVGQPAAVGKTFEVVGLAGYPKGDAESLTAALERLQLDNNNNNGAEDDVLSLEQVTATYATMQQLLPGETQDSAALAMGQTYEQLDQGETGRLGERGLEKVEEAGLRTTG
mmetsp:Transcript_10392/g.28709  ORF Transcript_10392/g.28709 Transcript_10392/m.28709 type:complete len:416 (+) Transcript_10392:162-1409(+)|eukprot:CAMPEP_0168754060 /NCGR_PEP_ID=MMETSP0724-20121128/19297_1 /TAXON_ID=265536 /ORGANISM="Amphiprora sp., Strain CCMP467" /LENGTH=415 /DNA_ID=CAMNT_0008802509 /DNA_START=112 /DNA_END=1359 /DNA_ORIENTATION=-